MYKLDLEKAEEPEIKLPTSVGSWKKQVNYRKTSTFASLTMLKPLTVWITTNCGKFFKRWEYQTTLLAPWEICMQVKKQQLEPDMEQWTGSKLWNKYVQAVYHHPAYLTYMQSISCEVPGWIKQKLESRVPGEIYVFLELPCFFDEPADVGNLVSGSSAFSKTSLNIWKFTVHVLQKPGLENLSLTLLACEVRSIVW